MKTNEITPAEFATWLLDRARMSDDRLGSKVLLAPLAAEAGIDRAEFNRLALAANQAHLVTLARIDWVGELDRDLVTASEIETGFGRYHAVLDPSV